MCIIFLKVYLSIYYMYITIICKCKRSLLLWQINLNLNLNSSSSSLFNSFQTFRSITDKYIQNISFHRKRNKHIFKTFSHCKHIFKTFFTFSHCGELDTLFEAVCTLILWSSLYNSVIFQFKIQLVQLYIWTLTSCQARVCFCQIPI